MAAYNQNKEMVCLLLKHKALVNSRNVYGDTPLHEAVNTGNLAIAKTLIKHGADVNVGELFSFNSTTFSVFLRIAVWYLSYLPIPHETFGKRPLHIAAKRGNNSMIELLLLNGADVNAQDTSGWTPLHYAIYHSQNQTTKLLLFHGANPHKKAKNGWSPIHFAAYKKKDPTLIDCLLEKGVDCQTSASYNVQPTGIACWFSSWKIFEKLAEIKYDNFSKMSEWKKTYLGAKEAGVVRFILVGLYLNILGNILDENCKYWWYCGWKEDPLVAASLMIQKAFL